MHSSYFNKLAKYRTPRFIIEITLLAFFSRFALVLPVAVLLSAVGVNLGDANITSFDLNKHLVSSLIYTVIIAPFIETLIFQWVPLTALKLLKLNNYLQIILATLLFAYAHLHEGLINFIGMLPIGFLLVWSFSVRRNISAKSAIFTVFIIHGLTNLIAMMMYLLTS